MQRPPQDGAVLAARERAVGLGVEECVDEIGGLLAGLRAHGVELCHSHLDAGAVGAEVVGQHLADRRGIDIEAVDSVEEGKVGLISGILRVIVEDDEVGDGALSLEPGEQHGGPAGVSAAVDGVGHRRGVGQRIIVGLGGDDGADGDRGIDGLHPGDELLVCGRVRDRIVRLAGEAAAGDAVLVVFPSAIALVADFPILEAIGRGVRDAQKVVAIVGRQRRGGADGGPVADRLPVAAAGVGAERLGASRIAVVVGDPRGGLLGSAAAVVHDHVGIRALLLDHGGKVGDVARPSPVGVAGDATVGVPVVIVGQAAARETQRAKLERLEAGTGLSVGGERVPHNEVGPVHARIERLKDIARIDREGDQRRGGGEGQRDVVDVECAGGDAAGILNPKAVEVGAVGDAE